MVKRIKRLLSVLLMLVIMTSNVSYAREIDWGDLQYQQGRAYAYRNLFLKRKI